MSNPFDYNSIKSLKKYIDRIGAEQLNFRKFIIKETHGNYYTEITIIEINAEGEISCNDSSFLPNNEEAKAIRSAFVNIKFPKQILANDIKILKKKLGAKASLHIFYDQSRKKIIMIQERREDKNGKKHYIPWTFFNDGEWRRMEPENGLPFWKPFKNRKMPKIMIHEGAKAAFFIDDLVNNPSKRKQLKEHPWGDELAEYEHWGMIGGALAPHRTNYKELKAMSPNEVVYICDNDWPGQHALQEVSKAYGEPMKGVRFDSSWPPSWDMADPMPEDMFYESGRFNGPMLKHLMLAASYATYIIPPTNKTKRSIITLKTKFKHEWFHCVSPDVFIHRDNPSEMYTTSEFNSIICPFSDVIDVARLVRSDGVYKGISLVYDPSKKTGISSSKRKKERTINTHCSTNVESENGDVKMFLDFIDILLTEEIDRIELLKWCATLIACKDIKMSYGVLLISTTQGVGKTTLGEHILAPLVGEYNVSYPSENEIVESQFNEWAAHKRLAVVNEIYAGNSSKAYNILKSIITDKSITINKKYQSTYKIDNWMHIFAASNSMRAMKLDRDDRRWFVPRITNQKMKPEYWRDFYQWLSEDGGVNKIKNWAEEFIEKNGPVLSGEHAPLSTWKTEVIEETLGADMTLISNTLDLIKEQFPDKKIIISDQHLCDLIRNQHYNGQQNKLIPRPMTIRNLAKSKDWFLCQYNFLKFGPWSISGNKKHTLICSSENMIKTDINAFNELGIIPLNLEDIYEI